MGFATALAAMSDGELEALLRARADLVSPRPATFAELASRAAGVHSVQAAMSRLDRFALQVLHTCCLLGDGTTATAVAGLLRDADGRRPAAPAVHGALDRLRALALVAGPGEAITVPGQTRQLLAYPAGLGRPAGALLATRPRGELDRISKLAGVAVGGNKKQQSSRLAEALGDQATVAALVQDAPAETRDLVEDLCRYSPVCRLPYDHFYGGRGGRSPAHWLVERGLLVLSNYLEAEMPREVGLALRGGAAFAGVEPECPPPAGIAGDPEAADKEAAGRADIAVRALAGVLGAWGQTPAQALKSGGLGVRELRRAGRAAELDERAVARLLEVARTAGLVACALDAAGETYLPTEAFDGWLDAPPAQRWSVLVEAWLATPCDLGAIGHRDGDGRLAPALLPDWSTDPAARRRRRAVLDQLACLAPGTAPHPEALARTLSWSAPMIWSAEPMQGAATCAAILDEAALLGVTGQGALGTAARLLVQGRRDEAVAAAARLLPDPAVTFTLQADLTCVAPGALSAGVAAELALLGAVESTGAATVYRFSETSLRRAFDAGRSAQDVQDFLEAHAPKGVPQALAYLVADSYRRHGMMRAGSVASYLRSEDPALVEQVLRMRRAGGLDLRVLAPGVVVSSAPVGRLLDALRANGFSPVEEDGAGVAVLAAPAQRRAPGPAPSRARRRGAVDPLADLGAVVAALRAGPAASAVPPAAGPMRRPPVAGRRPPGAHGLFDDLFDDPFDDPFDDDALDVPDPFDLFDEDDVFDEAEGLGRGGRSR